MIRFDCPGCDRQLQVKPEVAGGRAKCPHCGAVIDVPSEEVPYVEVVPQPKYRPAVAEADDDRERRRRHGVGFRCPYCNTDTPPLTRSKVSTGGWVTFILLLLLFCWPLCWIGLLIKEEYHVCTDCGMKLG
jgi:transcription elongation factor Elf1